MSSLNAKLGVVICDEPSKWKSCNSISQNLIHAYESAAAKKGLSVEWFQAPASVFNETAKPATALNLARRILKSKISELVILDHHVDPVPILIALRSLDIRRFRELRYSFHVYGDFSLFSGRWLQIAKLLRGLKVRLLCASERQRRLVEFFEPAGSSQAVVCPFAVNTELFAFDPRRRARWRKRFKLNDEQTVFIYTGRLSLQKCVSRLVEEFAAWARDREGDLWLALAGPIDDIAGMTSGIDIPHGYYFHHFERLLDSLPKDIRERILVLGDLSLEDLRDLYSGGDAFVSLSLYHDEDFGMAPAEALSSGLPAVLTDWGGYGAFRGEKIESHFVPVELKERGLNLNSRKIREAFGRVIDLSEAADRIGNGEAFACKFGFQAVSERIREIYRREIAAPFTGFSWPLEVVRDKRGTLSGELYKDVYERYVQ
jgi:glycosyltransferase involved in cell wall biosynthesis